MPLWILTVPTVPTEIVRGEAQVQLKLFKNVGWIRLDIISFVILFGHCASLQNVSVILDSLPRVGREVELRDSYNE